MKEATTAWRLLLVPPRSGAENMARDTGLMDRARATSETVFSVYTWEKPTLSLGRNQTGRGKYNLAEAKRRGVDIVRRPTGGRGLLHYREVTYSVTGPIHPAESLVDAYGRINRILLEGLRRLGVHAREWSSAEPTLQPGTLPCFASPANGELVSDGAKLVGSAQLRENGAFLQHGSILVDDDQSLIDELLALRKAGKPVPQAATLRKALGRSPKCEEVASALFAAVRQLEDVSASHLSETDTKEFSTAHIERYRSELWTWRK